MASCSKVKAIFSLQQGVMFSGGLRLKHSVVDIATNNKCPTLTLNTSIKGDIEQSTMGSARYS